MPDRQQLEQAIAAQESLRVMLGDAVVDATVVILREKLAELELIASPEQRKLVSILFADTVASTALSERLDPEDVLEIMDGALRAYTDAVGEYGGTVARLMGDGLLAFFGAPVAREDDALRAVRCGLAIVRAAHHYASTVEERWSEKGFAVRVGINTGLVALGEVGGASGSEWTAMGDAINLAARLQSAAPSDGILISHDTYRHVRGLFETRTLEPMRLKGKSEPVQGYLVEREKPRTFRVNTRGVEGIQTRMVGREAELLRMQQAFEWTMDESETQIVSIVGEPGVGKSRLLREFDAWVDDRPESVLHFTGRATPEMANIPYALFRNIFTFRFGIQDSDSASTVWNKLERGIAGFMGADSARKAHIIGNLLGFDFSASPHLVGEEPYQLTQFGLYYITEFFGKAAEKTPTVMLLDDMHWADDKSFNLLNQLLRMKRGLRLLIVCIARTALLERRSLPWGDQDDFHTYIELESLTPEGARELVCDILCRVENTPDSLVDTIVTTAEGNPFYVEEVIKMMIEDGVIVKGDEAWHIDASRLQEARIPPTLTGVLQARLDALPPAERTLLQRASVIGRIFWDSAVSFLQAEGEQPVSNLWETLESLKSRDLIRAREQTAFAGTQEYIFRHSILREVTYESVLRRLRRVYHAQAADWLIQQSGDRAGEYAGLIADHFDRSGQPQRALTYLARAAEQALNISAYREASSLAVRALNLLAEEHVEHALLHEAQLKSLLGQAYRSLSDYVQAQNLYQESLALFMKVDDKPGIVRVLYELGWLVGSIMRHYDAGVDYFQRSLKIARSSGDQRGIAWALNGLGAMAHLEGKHAEAITRYEESLSIARMIGDTARTAGALNNLGLVKAELGHYDEARQDLEASLAQFRAVGNRAGVASPLANLGNIFRSQGQHDEARQFFMDALTIYREIGNRSGVASTLYGLGSLARLEGEYESAKNIFGETVSISREIRYPVGIGSGLEELALLARMQGQYEVAWRYLEESLKIAQEIDQPVEIANVLLNQGAVKRAWGEYAAAKTLIEQGLAINREENNQRGVARSLYFLGDVELALHDEANAVLHYQASLDIYRGFDNRTGIILSLGGLGDSAVMRGDFAEARQRLYEAFTAASSVRDTPLTLWILSGIAGLLAQEGQKERSLEMIGLVLNHYASPQEARDKAESVLRGLQPELDTPPLSAALERGRGLAKGADKRRLGLDEQRWVSLLA
jgi:class 3 adenylate cyclase/tetratricopeptide (TPR) repeat protein